MRLIIAAALLPLAACGNIGGDDSPGIAATGTGTSRQWAVNDFNRVQLAGGDDVTVSVGGGFSVRAEGDSAALDRLKITRKDGQLSIGRRNGIFPDHHAIRVYVTLPALSAASIVGSGNMSVDRIEGGTFTATSAGSGDLRLARLRVGEARLTIAGSGDIAAAGEAKRLEVKLAGSGTVAAPALVASEGAIEMAGSGDVRATIRGNADVRMMGSGSVDLGNDATCTVTKMGSGSVHCR
jgi:hypothetical protein